MPKEKVIFCSFLFVIIFIVCLLFDTTTYTDTHTYCIYIYTTYTEERFRMKIEIIRYNLYIDSNPMQ